MIQVLFAFLLFANGRTKSQSDNSAHLRVVLSLTFHEVAHTVIAVHTYGWCNPPLLIQIEPQMNHPPENSQLLKLPGPK